MIAVEVRGVHMMGYAYLYMVHVVLQYATDVKNPIIKNLRQILGTNKNVTSLYCK